MKKHTHAVRSLTPAVLVAAVMAIIASSAAAQFLDEELKLVSQDAQADDDFGVAVAISGNTSVIGAPGVLVAGDQTGAAYVFDHTTGQQIFKLLAEDAARSDGFGRSVALSGNTAIVGAPGDDDAGSGSGSAYLFDVTSGMQLFKLTASDGSAGDDFGGSVSVSGTLAIVGAPTKSGVDFFSGAAYVFDTLTGQQLFKLTASDSEGFEFFGASVSIDGTTAIIGAWGDDLPNEPGKSAGSAYVFDALTGQQLLKLNPSDPVRGGDFGIAVGISGSIAVVGSQRGNSDQVDQSGAAYIFDTTTGEQLFKLTASDAAAGDNFGSRVAISGQTVIVGGAGDDDAGSGSGSAYLFDVTTGQQYLKLTASDAAARDAFGLSVAISGTAVIVGAPGDDDGGNDSGSAYIFDPCPSDWNGDGHVNIFDVVEFITEWNAATPATDFNNDDAFNINDVVAFITVWNNSCPGA